MLLVNLIILFHLKLYKLHWGHELTEKDFFINSINYIKTNYYQFNRQEILQKSKDRYYKDKVLFKK